MCVVIYGPQGCEKTKNAEVLAAAYGKKDVVDPWSHGMTCPEDSICLTNAIGVDGGINYSDTMKSVRDFQLRQQRQLG